jgi:hypothetical protein
LLTLTIAGALSVGEVERADVVARSQIGVRGDVLVFLRWPHGVISSDTKRME